VPVVYIRDIPDDLHKRIRVAAAIKGKSMQKLGLDALVHEVERIEAEEEQARRKREGKR
jgi:plasmid stability protein